MQKLQTLKLAGNYGVNFDLEPCDLELDWFTSGNNFRLKNGKIQTFSTGEILSTCPVNFNGARLAFINAAPSYFFLVAGLTKIYAFDGSTWVDVSSVAGYAEMVEGNQFNWTFCMLGDIPIFNNGAHVPEYWPQASSSSLMTPLQFSPTKTWKQMEFDCQVMRAHKNFLFAINMTEAGTLLPHNYRWSHPADNNGLPYTWDTTDLSSIAGQASILGNAGILVDGLSMRDDFCLYSSEGITILSYVGGEFIWSARALASNQGLLTKNCVVDIYGKHIFLSRDDLLMNDGNNVHSIAHRLIRTKIEASIDPTYFYKSYTSVDHSNKEVWFCVPQIGSTYPNIAFVYNYVDEKISVRDIDPQLTSLTYGLISFSSTHWNTLTNTWLEATLPWNFDKSSPFGLGIIGVEEPTSTIYNMSIAASTSMPNSIIERTSAQISDQREVTTICRVFPHIKSTGSVTISFGSQEFLGAPIIWDSPKLFTPNTDRKIEPRTTGMLHSWKIESYGHSEFTYSGMDIEYVFNGQR
jgi:hypothetical protein